MSTIEKITPDTISVDRQVQRAADEGRIRSIAENFRPDAFGVPTVSRRDNRATIVLDGQHRIKAAQLAGLGAQPFEMLVYEGLTIEQEAEMFRLLNNTRPLTPIDRFRIALVEKDPESVAINDIVEHNGYTTVPGLTGSCTAVTTLRAIYRRDAGDTLNRTLRVCTSTWDTHKQATHQAVLNALSMMLFRYGSTVDLARLSKKLREHRDGSTPTDLLGSMRSLAEANGTTPANAGAGKLVTIYNSHLDAQSSQRLGAWK